MLSNAGNIYWYVEGSDSKTLLDVFVPWFNDNLTKEKGISAALNQLLVSSDIKIVLRTNLHAGIVYYHRTMQVIYIGIDNNFKQSADLKNNTKELMLDTLQYTLDYMLALRNCTSSNATPTKAWNRAIKQAYSFIEQLSRHSIAVNFILSLVFLEFLELYYIVITY